MAIRTLGSRYLLDEQIGQGGMGVVWRGRDKVTGSPFAIKLLRSEYAADPDAVTRFVRERTVLMRFRHPAVVTLHDMIVEGDQLALVMDLVGGGDLNAYRQRSGGTLPPVEAARIAAQICDGLAAAHAAGIVHRDLKPANVLLDGGQVKLADFGVARIVGDQSGTTTGTVLGTAAYLAPELLTGSEPSAACDVYAFGITLYEVLAGRPPFTGHVAAIMHDHLQTEPPRLPDVPVPLWDLLGSCLAKDPATRPTAAAMAASLRDPTLIAALTPPTRAPVLPAAPSQASAPAPVGGHVAVGPPQSFAHAPGPVSPPVTPESGHPAPAADPPSQWAAVIPLHARPTQSIAASQLLTAPPAPSEAPSALPGAPMVAPDPALAPDAPFQAPFANPFQGGQDPQLAMPVVAPYPATGPMPSAAQPAAPRRPARQARRDNWLKSANPAVIGAAAVVAVALVATGIMALGHLGPFGSGHKPLAGGHPTAASGIVAPGQNASPQASVGASPRPSHSASGHAKTPKKTHPLPSVSASSSSSAKSSSGSGSGNSGSGSGGTLVPYGPNLALDGDFSDLSLYAWSYGQQNAVLAPGEGLNGANAVRLTATPQAGVAETISGMKPGHYLLTGWVEASNSPVYVGQRDVVSGDEVDRKAETSSWRKLSVQFSVPQGEDSAIIFCVMQQGGTGYCSDMTVYAMHRS
jgi:serine/threonine-protein kinase